MWKAMGSYCTYSSLVKLQPWFLNLQFKTCPLAEYPDDDPVKFNAYCFSVYTALFCVLQMGEVALHLNF